MKPSALFLVWLMWKYYLPRKVGGKQNIIKICLPPFPSDHKVHFLYFKEPILGRSGEAVIYCTS